MRAGKRLYPCRYILEPQGIPYARGKTAARAALSTRPRRNRAAVKTLSYAAEWERFTPREKQSYGGICCPPAAENASRVERIFAINFCCVPGFGNISRKESAFPLKARK